MNDLKLIPIVSPKALNHHDQGFSGFVSFVIVFRLSAAYSTYWLLGNWMAWFFGRQMLWKISKCWFSGSQNGKMTIRRCCAYRRIYAHFPTSNICIQVTNIRWLIHCHFKFIHYGCVCKNWGPRSSNTLRKIDISQGVVGILIGDRQAALVFRPLIFWGNIFLKILKEWLAADGNDWG